MSVQNLKFKYLKLIQRDLHDITFMPISLYLNAKAIHCFSFCRREKAKNDHLPCFETLMSPIRANPTRVFFVQVSARVQSEYIVAPGAW